MLTGGEHYSEKATRVEYRVCWLDSYGCPTDHVTEEGVQPFGALDEALEWDPNNCDEFLTWVESRPVVDWSTDLSLPSAPSEGHCACGAMTLATTLSENHARGLHSADRCIGGWRSNIPSGAGGER